MRPVPRRALTAIILAGGQGRRLGYRDKARLRLRGRDMLSALQQPLARQARTVIVVRRAPRDAVRLCGVRAWDRRRGQGPLFGVEAGLRRARTPWCLVVSVDSHQLPADLPRRLAAGGPPGAFAHPDGGPAYLHALLQRRQRHPLRRFLAAGGRAAANAWAELGLQAVPLHDSASIWSINTPAQRRQAQRRRHLP